MTGREWAPTRRWARGGPQVEPPDAGDAQAWVAGRVPDDWFVAPPTATLDRDEIIVLGELKGPDLSEDTTDADRSAAEQGRISRFREHTRTDRMAISRQMESRYQRRVSWGAVCGTSTRLFTNQSVPVMTRLRQPERTVLDTLVDSGVARSRSEALSWCVRLVGRHAEPWLDELREALTGVEELRRRGPELDD